MSRQMFYNHIQEAKAIKPARPIICNEDSQALAEMQVEDRIVKAHNKLVKV